MQLLRRTSRTVDDLAQGLDLTDNAVRAHLATLERDGLVGAEGVRRGPGSGKPATLYALTQQAETLFPKAYGGMLRELLGLLSERLQPAQLEGLIQELATRLAAGHRLVGSLEQRMAGAIEYLASLGGLAEFRRVEAGYEISGYSCPLAELLPQNPNACRLAELVLTDIIGAPVREHCQRDGAPRCRFHVPAPQPS